MIVREKVEFASTFPDDTIETEDTFILPGKNIAEALADIIQRLGYNVEPVENAGDHGWDFFIRAEKHNFYCQVTLIYDCLVQFNDTEAWYRFWKRHTPEYLDFLQRVSAALKADSRFPNVHWATHRECTTGRGFPEPIQQE
jgi:hypothetical protein